MQEPTSNDLYTNVEIIANGDLNGFEGEYDVGGSVPKKQPCRLLSSGVASLH